MYKAQYIFTNLWLSLMESMAKVYLVAGFPSCAGDRLGVVVSLCRLTQVGLGSFSEM
jgi:hypothetical protein